MTNTVATLRAESSLKQSLVGGVADQCGTTADTPPTRPPPPVRARARRTVQPASRRRAPAIPPPSADDDSLDEMLELDPVLQNERNDVIWQHRVGAAALLGTSTTLAVLEQERRDGIARRRYPSPQPVAAWTASTSHCRQCRLVTETILPASSRGRTTDLIDVKSVSNEYVDEPSTIVADAAATCSSVPLRLSDLTVETWSVPLKSPSSKDSVGSETSLRAAVTTHNTGVTCKQCGGCRCSSCQRTVLLCSCQSNDQCRSALRCVLAVCMPCLCSCWLWTVSTFRRCTGRPDVCRCRADSL